MDAVRLGLSLRALRRRRGWTQEDLAARAHLARSTVQRIERGGADDATGRALRSIATALDARFEYLVRWHGEELDRLLDAGHAAIVEHVVAWLRREGWVVAAEVTFAIGGERGSIDVLAFDERTGQLLVVEVKTVVPDMQGMLSGLDRKVRLAARVAAGRGWRATGVSRLLVLPGDSTTRRRAALHGETLATVLPARTDAVRAWVRAPRGVLAGILFLPRGIGTGASRHRVRSVA